MAVDEALLRSAQRGAPPTLRFYSWDGAWLSLGFAQSLDAARRAACRAGRGRDRAPRHGRPRRAARLGSDLCGGGARRRAARGPARDLRADRRGAAGGARSARGRGGALGPRPGGARPGGCFRLLPVAGGRRDLRRGPQARRQRPAPRRRGGAPARLAAPRARSAGRARGGRTRAGRRHQPRGARIRAGRRAGPRRLRRRLRRRPPGDPRAGDARRRRARAGARSHGSLRGERPMPGSPGDSQESPSPADNYLCRGITPITCHA